MKKIRKVTSTSFTWVLTLGLMGMGATACSSSGMKEVDATEEAPPADELSAEDTPADEVPEIADQTAEATAPPAEEAPPAEMAAEAAPATEEAAPVAAVDAPPAEEGVPDAVPAEPEAPVAAEPPAPAPEEPVAQAADTGGSENYSVGAGETLMKIAFDRYGDPFAWRKILDANRDRITDPSKVPAGTVLRLEKTNYRAVASAGDPYLIRRGDTLGTISKSVYGLTEKWKRLWENNKRLIRDPNKIFAGFMLYYTFTDQDRAEYAKATGREAPSRMPASSGR